MAAWHVAVPRGAHGCVTTSAPHTGHPAPRAATSPLKPAKWVENPPKNGCDSPKPPLGPQLFRSREELGESNARLLCFGRRSWFLRAFSLKRRRRVGNKQGLSRAGKFSSRKETEWFISVSSLLGGAKLCLFLAPIAAPWRTMGLRGPSRQENSSFR